MKSFARRSIEEIRSTVGDKKVILGLSGGVDSSVAAVLLHKSIGKQLTCIFVDNGVLRKDEARKLKFTLRRQLKLNIRFINAKTQFLKALAKVTDPEKKRKIIGRIFMQVFEAEARKIKDANFLVQGTLYPDVIESVSAFGGPTSVIKSHHNVGGLPKNMKLKLIEPLKYLFKDEVRLLGKELGLEQDLIWRQPFPGPGLAIRIIGEITHKRLTILRNVDDLLLEEIKNAGYYRKLWQSFAVLLPIKSVGVMGDPTRASAEKGKKIWEIAIAHLVGLVERKGYTLVPLSLYWKKGKAKLEIGLARGKKKYDKRAAEKDRDWQRQKERIMKQ